MVIWTLRVKIGKDLQRRLKEHIEKYYKYGIQDFVYQAMLKQYDRDKYKE